MRVVTEVDAAEIANPVILAMDAEPMPVLSVPVKGNLNVLMELSDGGLTRDQQAPPDHRADPGQHETIAVDRGSWAIPRSYRAVPPGIECSQTLVNLRRDPNGGSRLTARRNR